MWKMRRKIPPVRKVANIPAPLVIVSVALFVLSLAGVFITRSLPAEVEQDVTLLNYEHEGEFDYLVHVRPSHLYPPPPEEPPPNPVYPIAVVDTIDFILYNLAQFYF